MPIPNDRGPAIDAVLALDLGIESREAAQIVVDRVGDILRYAPMGDNHHNAAACPHCSPLREVTLATGQPYAVRSPEAEQLAQERDAFAVLAGWDFEGDGEHRIPWDFERVKKQVLERQHEDAGA